MKGHYKKIEQFFQSMLTPGAHEVRQALKRYYHQDIERLLRFLVPQGSTVLEIGCSDGKMLKALRPSRGVGAYVTISHLRNERAGNIAFVRSLPARIHGVRGTFDYLIFFNSLGYIDDIQQAFQEARKFCAKDSKLVITYYNYLWEPLLGLVEQLGLKSRQPVKQNWLSPADIENLLYLAGFDVIKRGERMLLPFYVPILASFFNRYLSQMPLFRRLCLTQYIVARPVPQAQPDYSVSVIVPARNEEGNIEEIVRRMPQLGSSTEIIFVEGNSRDHTRREIRRVMAKYKDVDIKLFVQKGEGKGDAVRLGFDKAKNDILMILDADLTVPPEDLVKFYRAIATGKGEFINGTRLVYPMAEQAMRYLNLLGNKFFSMMFSWLLNQRIKDTLCGTKVLFRANYVKIREGRNYFGDFDPFGDFDLLLGAAKLNMKIVEIPIRYRERTYGTTNISRFQHGTLLLRMCAFAARKIKFI